MFSSVTSGALRGIQSYLMQVETDISDGLPSFSMVGFLSAQVREAGERVRVALKNTGIHLPPSRITVNFSPANIPKYNMVIDLPVAAGLLSCVGTIAQEKLDGIFLAGELGLDGEVKPVRGVLAMVEEAAASGIRLCILPAQNAREGAVAGSRTPGMRVVGVRNLHEFIDYMNAAVDERDAILPPVTVDIDELLSDGLRDGSTAQFDFCYVRGQSGAKRALEIAAAGFHNVLMVGPPGSGKSMLSKCLPGIMPPLTISESMEISRIYSAAGMLPENAPLIVQRPVLSPHHSVTASALIGGGKYPAPGMISLAHRSVLFLDELPEFGKETLNLLRQPMEDHSVTISRVSGSCSYPANCLVLAAANSCPCGYAPDPRCKCTHKMISRYREKVPGPILDRFDLYINVPRMEIDDLMETGTEETSASVLERVMTARVMQEERFAGTEITFNAEISPQDMERFCCLGRAEKKFIRDAAKKLDLSARSYHRMLRTARTIADLDGSQDIHTEHLAEAAGYRASGWETPDEEMKKT